MLNNRNILTKLTNLYLSTGSSNQIGPALGPKKKQTTFRLTYLFQRQVIQGCFPFLVPCYMYLNLSQSQMSILLISLIRDKYEKENTYTKLKNPAVMW